MYQGNAYDFTATIPAALDAGLFPSLCTVQKPDGAVTDDGSPSGNFVDVPGLVDIPCDLAPDSNLKIVGDQVKTMAQIEATSMGHLLLAGYYPAFVADAGYRAIVDGVAWDVMSTESDSQKCMTRAKLQITAV